MVEAIRRGRGMNLKIVMDFNDTMNEFLSNFGNWIFYNGKNLMKEMENITTRYLLKYFLHDETFRETSQNHHKNENPLPYSWNSFDLAI